SSLGSSLGVRRRTLLGAGLAVGLAAPVAASLAACGDGRGEPGSGGSWRVRVLTGAGFQPWEAYLAVAEAKGWWAEAGLEVEVVPGEGTGRNLALLSAGQAEIATLDPAAAFIEWERGTGGF